nr:MAG TPA: hypothetical protein [Bacteriophage sp.]
MSTTKSSGKSGRRRFSRRGNPLPTSVPGRRQRAGHTASRWNLSGGERSWKTVARKLRNEIWEISYRSILEKYGTLSPSVEQAALITGSTKDNVAKKFPDGWSGEGRGKTINLGLLLDQYFVSLGSGIFPEK